MFINIALRHNKKSPKTLSNSAIPLLVNHTKYKKQSVAVYHKYIQNHLVITNNALYDKFITLHEKIHWQYKFLQGIISDENVLVFHFIKTNKILQRHAAKREKTAMKKLTKLGLKTQQKNRPKSENKENQNNKQNKKHETNEKHRNKYKIRQKYINKIQRHKEMKEFITHNNVTINQYKMDQTPINLSQTYKLNKHEISLLQKGEGFVPNTQQIDLCDLQQSMDKVKNQMRAQLFFHKTQNKSKNKNNDETKENENIHPNCEYWDENIPRISTGGHWKKSENENLESFFNAVRLDLINTNEKYKYNLTKQESFAMSNLKKNKQIKICMQDKGSKFVIMDAIQYYNKMIAAMKKSNMIQVFECNKKLIADKYESWLNKFTKTYPCLNTQWANFLELQHHYELYQTSFVKFAVEN